MPQTIAVTLTSAPVTLPITWTPTGEPAGDTIQITGDVNSGPLTWNIDQAAAHITISRGAAYQNEMIAAGGSLSTVLTVSDSAGSKTDTITVNMSIPEQQQIVVGAPL